MDTTFPLFSRKCQVGRAAAGGTTGGRIDAINANYWWPAPAAAAGGSGSWESSNMWEWEAGGRFS